MVFGKKGTILLAGLLTVGTASTTRIEAYANTGNTQTVVEQKTNVDSSVYEDIVASLNAEYGSDVRLMTSDEMARSQTNTSYLNLSPEDFEKALREEIENTQQINEEIRQQYEKDTGKSFDDIEWIETKNISEVTNKNISESTPRYIVGEYYNSKSSTTLGYVDCFLEATINNRSGGWLFESIQSAYASGQIPLMCTFNSTSYTATYVNSGQQLNMYYKGNEYSYATNTMRSTAASATFYAYE